MRNNTGNSTLDDETDYYSSETNTWLSTKEKERLKSKEEAILAAREEREKQRRVTIDIAGRRVVESAFDEEDKGLQWFSFFLPSSFFL